MVSKSEAALILTLTLYHESIKILLKVMFNLSLCCRKILLLRQIKTLSALCKGCARVTDEGFFVLFIKKKVFYCE